MRIYKFLPYVIIALVVLCFIYFFMIGEVTINVKDASSKKYITNVNIKIQPDLNGVAGPGTDGSGPRVYEGHMPDRYNLYISASGYKDKSLNLILIPFKIYTIYLESKVSQ